MPPISRKNCSRQKTCIHLHLCQEYLSGTCKRDDCQGHDVFAEDATYLLERYGVEIDREEWEIIEDLRYMGLTTKVFPKSPVGTGTDKSESGMRKGRAQNCRKIHDNARKRDSRSLNMQTNTSMMSVANPHPQMQGLLPPPGNPMPENQQNMPYLHHGNHPAQMPKFPNPPPNYYHRGPPQPILCNPGQPWPLNYAYSGPPHPNQWNHGHLQPCQQYHFCLGPSQPNQLTPGPSQPQSNYPTGPPEFQQGETSSLSGEHNEVIYSRQQQEQQRHQKQTHFQKQQTAQEKATGHQTCKTGPKELERESAEICPFNFRKCFMGDNCSYHHKKVMFQWQYKVKGDKGQGDKPWCDFDYDSNTELERTFSYPEEDTCPVAFRKGELITIKYDDMAGCSKRTKINVRRLSTASSVAQNLRPVTYKWSTVWKWFWQNEAGTWIEYGEKDKQGLTSCKNSETIEQSFLADPIGIIEFETPPNYYKLDLDNMVQINTTTPVQRRVRRRPKFFTKDELKNRPTPNFMQSNKAGLTGWSIGQSKNPEQLAKHYAEIKVDETSEEYEKVSALFYETLPFGRKISSVERIENGELWNSFEYQRLKMKRKAGGTGTVAERSLFHGTTQEKTEAICRQGFDFRFSGFRVGTKYGRGSYFAKEAKYSDNFAEKSDKTKKMFLARVLVGEFTEGDKNYVRPPKSTENPHDLYDSCVDCISDPNIFVVFAVDQAYPEYIITYTCHCTQQGNDGTEK